MKSSIVIAFGYGSRKEEEKNVQEKCQSNTQCNGTIHIVPNDSLSYFCAKQYSMTIWISIHHTFGQNKTKEWIEMKGNPKREKAKRDKKKNVTKAVK